MTVASSARNDLDDAAQSALFRLAVEYNQRAAVRIIHALQRRHASRIFGRDYAHLWDELCHDARSGPYLGDNEPCYGILDSLLRKEVERLTAVELEALLLAAIPDVEDLTTAPRNAEVRSALLQRAGERNLERFEVW